jgi:hypothetical protein
MIKKRKRLLPGILVFVIIIFILNIAAFYFKIGDVDDGSKPVDQTGFTGQSVLGDTANLYLTLPTISKIFLIVQWGLLLLLLVYVGFKDKEVKKHQNELAGLDMNQIRKKSTTDLDTLYDLLKQRQHLRISTIAQAFEIKEDLAMEWGKILESGRLAYIDYPKFGGPLIRIKTKEKPGEERNLKEDKEQLKQQTKQEPGKQQPVKKVKEVTQGKIKRKKPLGVFGKDKQKLEQPAKDIKKQKLEIPLENIKNQKQIKQQPLKKDQNKLAGLNMNQIRKKSEIPIEDIKNQKQIKQQPVKKVKKQVQKKVKKRKQISEHKPLKKKQKNTKNKKLINYKIK